MNYEVKMYSSFCDELKINWLLIENNSQNSCFNTLSWIENYFSTCVENDSKIRIFVIFSDQKPICVLPFEIIKKFKTNILQWAGSLKSDFNSPLVQKNYKFDNQSFNDIWNRILKMLPEIDVVYLQRQIYFSENLNNPFINFVKNYKEGTIKQIELPSKWDTYKDKVLKNKFYLDLLRTKRQLKKIGKVEFVIAKNIKEKKIFIDSLIAQKKINLQKNKKNILNDKDIAFYKNFENYENRKFETHVSALKLNGEFVALHWGIVDNRCFYYLFPAMKDGEIKRFSPGKLLLSLLIRWAISKKKNIFDFGYGEETYKKRWSNKSNDIYNYIKLIKIQGIFFYFLIKLKQIAKSIQK